MSLRASRVISGYAGLLACVAGCAGGGALGSTASALDSPCVIAADGASAQPTDNAPAIQACLDGAGARGGRVTIPPGVYAIDRALRIPSGVTLAGAGAQLTTLRLAANDTPKLPLLPPECSAPDPDFPPFVPSAGIYNAGNLWFTATYWYDPNNGRCYSNGAAGSAPLDHDVGLAHLTIDCNGDALWSGQAAEGNAGCLFFDNLDGLTIDDVVERGGAVDGIDLGSWSANGVTGFAIRDSHFRSNQRYGLGWIEAADGRVERSSFDDNGGGGLDMETDVATYRFHDVRFKTVQLTGRPSGTAYDDGLILAFDTGDFVNERLRFEDVAISDFRGYGIMMAWGGAYDDVVFDVNMRDIGLGCFSDGKSGLVPTLPHRARLSGTLLRCSTLAGNDPPVSIQEDAASGWSIGPLTVHEQPAWSNGTLIWVSQGVSDFLVHDVHARLDCDPSSSGCAASNFVYQTGVGAYPEDSLAPALRIVGSSMIWCGGANAGSSQCP